MVSFLFQLIGSDQPSFDLFKPYCATWYQMMVSMLLFTDPIVKIHDLNYHANQCIEYFGGRSKLKLLDHTILALVDSNLNLVSSSINALSSVTYEKLLKMISTVQNTVEQYTPERT